MVSLMNHIVWEVFHKTAVPIIANGSLDGHDLGVPSR